MTLYITWKKGSRSFVKAVVKKKFLFTPGTQSRLSSHPGGGIDAALRELFRLLPEVS